MKSRRTVISREAYTGFVSFVFAAALVSWGTTFLGINPLAEELFPPDAPGPRRLGLDYLRFLPDLYLVAGLLYGVVLICFYWIYAEYLTSHHLPRHPLILPLDFIALSFMTGAASSWIDPKSFVFLAFATVMFLMARFGVAARSEWLEKIPFEHQIMSHIVIIYCALLLVLVFMFAGGALFGGAQPLPEREWYDILYKVVMVAMAFGIGITTWHALKNRPYSFSPASMGDVVPASEYGTPLPRLVPDYRVASDNLPQIALDVRAGEAKFRSLLMLHSGTRTLSPHLSRVHSLRDVETQAFIMAHSAEDSVARQLRAMWVYLTHWFDDLFDNQYPNRLAREYLQGNFAIDQLLGDLDEAYVSVWRAALQESKHFKNWNADLLETGFRRLILGGPLFSPRCDQERKSTIREWHRDLVTARLSQEGQDLGIRELIENTSPRHLDHTAKVVVEIWDSFEGNILFSTSVLMKYFYSPGLLYHDYSAEADKGEIEISDQDVLERHVDALRRVYELMMSFPDEQLAAASKPVPMFLRCFLPVLEEAGRRDLLNVYRDIVGSDKMRRITGYSLEDYGIDRV